MKNFLQKHIRIDLNKNSKLSYYLLQLITYYIPHFYYRKQLYQLLEQGRKDEKLLYRLNYYNKIQNSFCLDNDLPSISTFKKSEKKKTYYFDLLEHLKYFESKLKISYLFGDITTVPKVPSLLKSRPINGKNHNSILMKLDKVRHFIFVNDKFSFEEKKNMAVWRGKSYQEHRKSFVQNFYQHPLCDIGQTNTRGDTNTPWQKAKLSLNEQLKYKFIISIEGYDVASNLKWVMSSNSLSFMAKPKYETWFMEGTLVPNHHYVLLKDDYSDLEEKIQYYSKHTEEAKSIITNANNFVAEFKNEQREQLLSLMVLEKFFHDSGQTLSFE